MKTIQLSVQKAAELYKTASPEFKQLLEQNFTKEQLSEKITDRMKSWLDLVEFLGGKYNIHLPYWDDTVDKKCKSQNAFAKIQYINDVLNEGWKPDFNNRNEYKWFPYFEKTKSGWVFLGSLCFGSSGCMGSGFYFKSKELSDYAGRQFLDIYKEYLPE